MPVSIFDDSYTLLVLSRIAKTCPLPFSMTHFGTSSNCKNVTASTFDDGYTLFALFRIAKTSPLPFLMTVTLAALQGRQFLLIVSIVFCLLGRGEFGGSFGSLVGSDFGGNCFFTVWQA